MELLILTTHCQWVDILEEKQLFTFFSEWSHDKLNYNHNYKNKSSEIKAASCLLIAFGIGNEMISTSYHPQGRYILKKGVWKCCASSRSPLLVFHAKKQNHEEITTEMSGCCFLDILILTYFQCSCRVLIFSLSCYCTLDPEHLSEVAKYYYSCLINGERRVKYTEVHLLKLTLFWCPVFTKSFT